MGELVYLRDFHLKRVERAAEELKGQLFAFAKEGEPVVVNADPWAGRHVPEGIDGLDLDKFPA
jgi:hypothetical protein